MSIEVHVLQIKIFIPLAVEEILLPGYITWSTIFRGMRFNEEVASSLSKPVKSVLFEFMERPIPFAAFSWECSGDLNFAGYCNIIERLIEN